MVRLLIFVFISILAVSQFGGLGNAKHTGDYHNSHESYWSKAEPVLLTSAPISESQVYQTIRLSLQSIKTQGSIIREVSLKNQVAIFVLQNAHVLKESKAEQLFPFHYFW